MTPSPLEQIPSAIWEAVGRKANFIKYFNTKIQLLILYLFHLTKQKIMFVVEIIDTLIQI